MSTSSELSDGEKDTGALSPVGESAKNSDSGNWHDTFTESTYPLPQEHSKHESEVNRKEHESFDYRLRTALKNNDVDLLNGLLQEEGGSTVELELTNDAGLALMDGAANKGYAVVVRALLDSGVDADTPDHILYTPINNAAFNGHVDVVLALLESGKINPNLCGKSHLTSINSAACNGHVKVVQAFLEYGKVNPNLPDIEGCTPINNAAINGHDDVVRVLLEDESVDPNFPDKHGRTPICNAAKKGHLLVLITLRKNDRVDSTLPDKEGLAPIDWARKNEFPNIVEALLVNPNENK